MHVIGACSPVGAVDPSGSAADPVRVDQRRSRDVLHRELGLERFERRPSTQIRASSIHPRPRRSRFLRSEHTWPTEYVSVRRVARAVRLARISAIACPIGIPRAAPDSAIDCAITTSSFACSSALVSSSTQVSTLSRRLDRAFLDRSCGSFSYVRDERRTRLESQG
jgi:hypothetical protein